MQNPQHDSTSKNTHQQSSAQKDMKKAKDKLNLSRHSDWDENSVNSEHKDNEASNLNGSVMKLQNQGKASGLSGLKENENTAKKS